MSSMRPLRYLVVTCGDSWISRLNKSLQAQGATHRFVLLIKIVDVSVENLDKQLDGSGRLHARVRHAEGALETFQDAFAVAVELIQPVNTNSKKGKFPAMLTSVSSVSPFAAIGVAHHK
jgi:hypothetical protein